MFIAWFLGDVSEETFCPWLLLWSKLISFRQESEILPPSESRDVFCLHVPAAPAESAVEEVKLIRRVDIDIWHCLFFNEPGW